MTISSIQLQLQYNLWLVNSKYNLTKRYLSTRVLSDYWDTVHSSQYSKTDIDTKLNKFSLKFLRTYLSLPEQVNSGENFL